MTAGVVAGIDVGNSTTEVVLLAPGSSGVQVVGHGRTLTQGVKGSQPSVSSAARLAQRVARQSKVSIGAAAIAPLRAVHTACRTATDPAPDTAPLQVLARGAATAAGDGTATGKPVPLEELASCGRSQDLVVLADIQHHYREVAQRVSAALLEGAPVVGVLTARDEAVLVANRLPSGLPVIDQVSVRGAVGAEVVALEARPLGGPLTRLTDPFWLAATFGLSAESHSVQAVSASLGDSSYGVVVLHQGRPAAPIGVPSEDVVKWADGMTTVLTAALTRLHSARPGTVAGIASPDGGFTAAEDAYGIHLGEVAQAASSRRGTVRDDRIVTALLHRDIDEVEPAALLEALLGVPIRVADSEAYAGRLGALTTPGVPADALVVDLGGGTVDASDGSRLSVVAGAGELLTRVTAEGLGVPTGTAEHAKRGPALHVMAPQVVLDEKGARSFLDSPAVASAVGAVCTQGPVGLVPFTRDLGIGEWRAWRLAAKRLCIGRNVQRALAALESSPAASLVLVGGAAGDDEVVAAVTEALQAGVTVGRGDVAGLLGHRCAVAYGLAAGGFC